MELTGDVSPDIRAIEEADVIVTTPEKWDGISRSWQNRTYVQVGGARVGVWPGWGGVGAKEGWWRGQGGDIVVAVSSMMRKVWECDCVHVCLCLYVLQRR